MNRRGSLAEFLEYLSVSVGMALACGGYAVLGRMFARSGGPSLLLAIAVAAVLCLILALAMGELSSIFPSAPGIRTYLRAGLGDAVSVGFTVLLLLLVMLFAGIEGQMLAVAARVCFPGLGKQAVGLSVIGVVTLMNLLGVDLPRRAQVAMTLLLLGVLGWATVSGMARPGALAAPHVAATVGVLGFAQLVVGAVFLFTGFEWVAPLGRRPDAYRAQIPLAMCAAVLVLGVIFAGLVAALDKTGASLGQPDIPHVMLAAALSSPLAVPLMVGASVLSAFTTLNAGLIGMARLVYALAREGVMPRALAALSPRTGAPWRAVVVLGCGAVVLALVEWRLDVVEAVAAACGAIYCWVYGAYLAAAARLRRRGERRPMFFSRLGVPVLWVGSVLFFALGIAVAAQTEQGISGSFVVFALVVVGGLCAAVLRQRRIVNARSGPLRDRRPPYSASSQSR